MALQESGREATPNPQQETQGKSPKEEITSDKLVLTLCKSLLLLASLVATVTYAVGFNPPLGVWQETAGGHLVGDPIVRDTHHRRYLFFFVSNTAAFASSLVVIVLILLIDFLHKHEYPRLTFLPLRSVLLLDLASLLVAYAAGACRDLFTALYFAALVAVTMVLLAYQIFQDRKGATCMEPDVENAASPPDEDSERRLGKQKVFMMLATFVVSVTYVAGLSTPGGFWDSTDGGHSPGDPILESGRLRAFFVGNTTAFVASLQLIVVLLDRKLVSHLWRAHVFIAFIAIALVGLLVAYVAGSCRETDTTVHLVILIVACTAVQVALFFLYVYRGRCEKNPSDPPEKEQPSHHDKEQPWSDHDKEEPSNKDKEEPFDHEKKQPSLAIAVVPAKRMGSFVSVVDARTKKAAQEKDDSIINDDAVDKLSDPEKEQPLDHDKEELLDHDKKQPSVAIAVVPAKRMGSFVSVVDARTKKAAQEKDDSVIKDDAGDKLSDPEKKQPSDADKKQPSAKKPRKKIRALILTVIADKRIERLVSVVDARTKKSEEEKDRSVKDAVDKARSLVLLLATLAATITYQAGLNPPGGLWQENADGHKAGDPILLTTNARRYKAFFYCNSISFATSLVAIVVVHSKLLLAYHVLEVAMVLDLFGLIGAYAAGSCRDMSTSIYVLGLAGAVLFYVVVHVVLLTLGDKSIHKEEEKNNPLEKTRKRLLLFAILAATITYQAGLTPPGGFRLQDDQSGHHAGEPVLFYNYPRRYHAFFYSNSVSFMLSIALIILLVNPHVYRPAIRTYALPVCTLVGLFALTGAYAAGSTQHLKTSIYIFVLLAVLLFVVVAGLIVFLVMKGRNKEIKKDKEEEKKKEKKKVEEMEKEKEMNVQTAEEKEKEEEEKSKKRRHAKRKYLMLLGVLVASVTYQAGLTPPGGTWQSNGGGHQAGNSVMHDNRRIRYLLFFYSNAASFVTSVVVIGLSLHKSMQKHRRQLWLEAMHTMILLDLLALLGAYAAGTSRGWKTSVYVISLVVAVFVYIALHVTVSVLIDLRRTREKHKNDPQPPTTVGGQGSSETVSS